MSPKSINKALDKVGEDYSTRLTQKKQEVSNYLERENELKHQIKEIGTRVVELERTLVENNDFTLHADLVSAINQSREVLQSLKDNLDKLKKQRPSSYCLVLDNLDIRIEASDMTSENQNKDHHWCNHNAVFDRVNPVELPDDKPLACILDVPKKVLLPALKDNKNILNDFAVLVSRVFVENLSSFEIFKDCIPVHIKHKYSEELKRPTDKVNHLSPTGFPLSCSASNGNLFSYQLAIGGDRFLIFYFPFF